MLFVSAVASASVGATISTVAALPEVVGMNAMESVRHRARVAHEVGDGRGAIRSVDVPAGCDSHRVEAFRDHPGHRSIRHVRERVLGDPHLPGFIGVVSIGVKAFRVLDDARGVRGAAIAGDPRARHGDRDAHALACQTGHVLRLRGVVAAHEEEGADASGDEGDDDAHDDAHDEPGALLGLPGALLAGSAVGTVTVGGIEGREGALRTRLGGDLRRGRVAGLTAGAVLRSIARLWTIRKPRLHAVILDERRRGGKAWGRGGTHCLRDDSPQSERRRGA